jgi:uncharacterized protein (TIGR02266 family)
MDQPSSPESNALTLRIKFKSASLEDFISRYGVDVSPGGIFIRTKQPVDVGTTLQFDFSLADGSPLLSGLGTVAWVRENDPARANNVPGMGLRFDKLTPESQHAHQTILAEKARKEGKPQGTPYPPTAFVVPASRPSPTPESARPAVDEPRADSLPKVEPSPANFAKTLPAPAAALAARMQEGTASPRVTDYSDEFESGGKTEISDKPLDYFIQEAEAAQAAAAPPPAATPEEAAPKSDIEEWKTDAHTEEGLDAAPPAPEEVSLTDSQAYSAEVPPSEMSASPASTTQSGERRPSDKDFFASMLDMGDTSETKGESPPLAAAPVEDGSGVPIEEAIPEKTEEFSLSPTKTGEEASEAAEPVDLGGAKPADEVEDQPVPSLGEIPFPETKRSAKRGSALMVAAVIFSGAAAFAAVYLLQTKPWQMPSQGEEPAPITKKVSAPASPAAAAPSAEKAAAEKPAKVGAAAEKTVAQQPAAPEPKPAVVKEPPAKAEKLTAAEQAAAAKAEKMAAAKAAAEKAAAEKAAKVAAAKAAAEQAAAEKAAKVAAAKAAAEQAAAEKAAKVAAAKAAKAAGKPAAKATAVTSSEPASAAKPAAASEQEEIYRLAFRSSPIGAEVLIDGEYYARTPCERRILDPKKPIAITIRKAGYEPHERVIGSSDTWVKKEGGERVLSVMVVLKKAKVAEPESAPAAGEGKAKPEPEPDEPYKE